MVVIAMPGCVHLTMCCFSNLPVDRRVVVIANGCSEYEVEILSSLDADVYETGAFIMSHGRVVEALLMAANEPFWLVDHDCFLRDRNFLAEIECEVKIGNTIGATVFTEGCGLGLSSSGIATFLMYLNPEKIRAVQSKFRAGAGAVTWAKMSRRSRQMLLKLGVTYGMYPQHWKSYFDTFRLIDALAHHEEMQFIRSFTFGTSFHLNNCAVHLGQTSRVFWPDDLQRKQYAAIGAFGSQLLFEKMCDVFSGMNGGGLELIPDSAVLRACLIKDEVLSANEVQYFASLTHEFEAWLMKHFDP